MGVKDGDNYILVGSQGGAPKDPAWVHNLRADPHIELRDETIVRSMLVREVNDMTERARLWTLAVAAATAEDNVVARATKQQPNLCRQRLGPRGPFSMSSSTLRGAAHPVANIRTSEHHILSRPRLSVRMFGS